MYKIYQDALEAYKQAESNLHEAIYNPDIHFGQANLALSLAKFALDDANFNLQNSRKSVSVILKTTKSEVSLNLNGEKITILYGTPVEQAITTLQAAFYDAKITHSPVKNGEQISIKYADGCCSFILKDIENKVELNSITTEPSNNLSLNISSNSSETQTPITQSHPKDFSLNELNTSESQVNEDIVNLAQNSDKIKETGTIETINDNSESTQLLGQEVT